MIAPGIPALGLVKHGSKVDNLLRGADDAVDLAKGTDNAADAAKATDKAADGEKTYQTYTKINPETGEVYSGRTSGTGAPEENVATRDRYHHKNKDGYSPARLDKSSSNPDAIRGRAQQNVDKHGGAQSDGGTSGNKIREVARRNPNAKRFSEAADREFR